MSDLNKYDNDYIVDDRPIEIPEDMKNMSQEELETEFKKRFPEAE